MKTDFNSEIQKAINSKWTGRLIFIGPEGGVVRVAFIDGRIKEVDSTWGVGAKELEKIKKWKEGNVIAKDLNEKEIEKLKVLPDIEYKFNCPNCSFEIPINTNFCPECGYQIRDVKVCLNCGFENPPDAKFCEKCGNKFYIEQTTKNVKICPNCSSSISQKVKFCPECGYSFLKICPRCKSENPSDAKFCEECGYEFKEKKFSFYKIFIPFLLSVVIISVLIYYFLIPKSDKIEILQAPNVIQEFVSFSKDTTKTKIETLNIQPKRTQKIYEIKKEIKKTENDTQTKISSFSSPKKFELTCERENYSYKEIKVPSTKFEINENKVLPFYKYGPIKLSSYDTLIVNFEIISGILRSKEAIIVVLNSNDIGYLETDYYKTSNYENYQEFVSLGFNLPFFKVYANKKTSFKFTSKSYGDYYIVVINAPFIEQNKNKIYIKSNPLFFNIIIDIVKCKEKKES
jgi:ribosomal protein L40E